jgi:hypothetical protein
MECKKIHGMNNTQFSDVQQAKAIYNFKNAKEKLCRTNAHLKYFLDLRSFVFNELPRDDTLVLKYVGDGT